MPPHAGRSPDLSVPTRPPPLHEASGRPVRTSAVVFSYDEEAALRRCLPALLVSGLEQIVVMYGGEGSRAYLESLADGRLELEREEGRAGKWRAYNRAITKVRGDLVFLISGDIRFDPSALEDLARRFEPDVGVVFPRVVPTNVDNAVSRMGAALWDVHDLQIQECERRGLPVHGGELQAVRRELLEPLEGTINDDAFLCLHAAAQGYRVLYDRSAVVFNTVPETVRELVRQRTRVNFGHRQLADQGYAPSTLDRFLWRKPGLCAGVLGRAVVERPANAVRLPLLAGVELLALARGTRDFARGTDHGRWTLVRSGKGPAFPGGPADGAPLVPEK
jgi:GT2 family glycosyltransferase